MLSEIDALNNTGKSFEIWYVKTSGELRVMHCQKGAMKQTKPRDPHKKMQKRIKENGLLPIIEKGKRKDLIIVLIVGFNRLQVAH